MKDHPQVVEFKMIEKGEHHWIMYSQGKGIMLMSPRDNLIKLTRHPQPDGKILYITQTTTHKDYPERDGIIRMDIFKATMAEQKGPDLHVLEFSNFDMKGYFPVRLMNMMLGSMVSKGLGEFYERMKKA